VAQLINNPKTVDLLGTVKKKRKGKAVPLDAMEEHGGEEV
jgi:hypothetical protein